MKQSIKIILLAAGLFFFNNLSAQQKIAHINSNEILMLMPELTDVKTKLESFQKQFEEQLTSMETELQKKYSDYEKNREKMAPSIREIKEKELQDLQMRMQNLEQKAQQELSAENEKLMSPVIKKIKDAISAAAKEGNYAYVIDTSTGAAIYFHDADNLMNPVKKKLAIKDKN